MANSDDFYVQRDKLVGGTDNRWTPNWDNSPNIDGEVETYDPQTTFSGVLSQQELSHD